MYTVLFIFLLVLENSCEIPNSKGEFKGLNPMSTSWKNKDEKLGVFSRFCCLSSCNTHCLRIKKGEMAFKIVYYMYTLVFGIDNVKIYISVMLAFKYASQGMQKDECK